MRLSRDSKSSKATLTDLHASTETEDEMESGLLLNIVIREGATVFQLLPSKDETLLIRRNSFLVLDLRLYIVDGVARFYLKSNGLTSDWNEYQ